MINVKQAGQLASKAVERLNRPGYEAIRPHRRKVETVSLVLFLVIVVLSLWDVVLATNSRSGDTWSEQARLAAPTLPILPWVLGAMVGHIFPWGRRSVLSNKEASGGTMALFTGAILLWTALIQAGVELPVTPSAFWVVALLGVGSAYVLWPMRGREGAP